MNLEKNYTDSFADGLRPEPILTVWQWADKHRILSSRASAEPGRYRTERTPYMREIMDVMSTHDRTEELVFMKSAQVGFTEVLNNYIGYIIDHSPGPLLLVQPTVEAAKRNSKMRIDPLIEESPSLSARVKERRTRDSSNTVLAKEFPGGMLVMTGANSAVGLRSMPCRYLLLDEIDGYPADADGEGNPLELARARTRTFSRRKIVEGSTPTISGRSQVEDIFERSDQRYFYVPCPRCGHRQTLVFENLIWEKNKPKTAKYKCSKCEHMIDEWRKTQMLNAGRWVPHSPQAEVAGFHLNALYSPVGWYSWVQIAKDWLKAYKNPALRKAFVNTALAKTYKDDAYVPDYKRLYERRCTYTIGTVPQDVRFLTAGVDVQGDRLEVEVVGWARGKITYSITYQTLVGDTTQPKVWKLLDELIQSTFPMEEKPDSRMGIAMLAIDSGFNTQRVYSWVRTKPADRVIAVKGSATLQQTVGRPKQVDIKMDGKTIRRGVRVWAVGVCVVKAELYSWLNQEAPTELGEQVPEGYCFFPEYDSDYFKMLTAEEQQITFKKGFRVVEWVKIRERNEALDVRAYARAAACVLGMDRFTENDWKRLDNSPLLVNIEIRSPKNVKQKTKRPRRKRNEWL